MLSAGLEPAIQEPESCVLSDKVLKLEINDKGVFIDNTEIEEKDDDYHQHEGDYELKDVR